MTPEQEHVLTLGLQWLFDTEQPDTAVLTHHGATLRADGRWFAFVPEGWARRAIVTVNVGKVEWRNAGFDRVPSNPLDADELDQLVATVERLGAKVVGTWNGHPATTGSVALERPAHPSLVAAVDRYQQGCQQHPNQSVFCVCGWYTGALLPSVLDGVR